MKTITYTTRDSWMIGAIITGASVVLLALVVALTPQRELLPTSPAAPAASSPSPVSVQRHTSPTQRPTQVATYSAALRRLAGLCAVPPGPGTALERLSREIDAAGRLLDAGGAHEERDALIGHLIDSIPGKTDISCTDIFAVYIKLRVGS